MASQPPIIPASQGSDPSEFAQTYPHTLHTHIIQIIHSTNISNKYKNKTKKEAKGVKDSVIVKLRFGRARVCLEQSSERWLGTLALTGVFSKEGNLVRLETAQCWGKKEVTSLPGREISHPSTLPGMGRSASDYGCVLTMGTTPWYRRGSAVNLCCLVLCEPKASAWPLPAPITYK